MTGAVIADHQTLVRDAFRVILECEGDVEVVGETADGVATVQVARRPSSTDGLPPELADLTREVPGRQMGGLP